MGEFFTFSFKNIRLVQELVWSQLYSSLYFLWDEYLQNYELAIRFALDKFFSCIFLFNESEIN